MQTYEILSNITLIQEYFYIFLKPFLKGANTQVYNGDILIDKNPLKE